MEKNNSSSLSYKSYEHIVMNNISDLVVFHDLNNDILWANKAALDSLSMTLEQVKGQKCYTLWHNRDLRCEGCNLNETVKSGTSWQSEVTTENGKSWIIRAYPVFDNNGNIIGAVEFATDITERRANEKELELAQKKYIKLFENANDAIFIANAETGIIVDVNKKGCEMLELPAEKIIGMHQSNLHPSEDVARYVAIFKEHVKTGGKISETLMLKSSTGFNIPVEISANIIEVGGQTLNIGIFRNVSESHFAEIALKESEERYHSLFSDSPTPLLLLDFYDLKCELENNHQEIFSKNTDFLSEDEKAKIKKFLSLINIIDINSATRKLFKIETDKQFDDGLVPYLDNSSLGEIALHIGSLLSGVDRIEGEIKAVTTCNNPIILSFMLLVAPGFEQTLSKVYVSLFDITDRKQTEEALRQSEHEFRKLVDNALVGIYKTNLKGEVLYVNDFIKKKSEGDFENGLDSRNLLDIYENKSDRELFISKLKKHGFVHSFKTRFKSKSGNVSDVLLSGTLDGETITGMILDITDIKKIEHQLRLTQFAIDNTSDSAFWMNSKGELIYVNQAACDSLGYKEEELLKMKVSDFDPNFPENYWSEHWQEIKNGKALFLESEHIAADGKRFPVEVRNNYLDFDGNEYNCAFARDISHRKYSLEVIRESETQYRALFENAPIGLGIADQDGNLIAYNNSMLTPGKYSAQEMDSIGNIFALISNEEDRKKILKKANSDGFVDQEELTLKTKDGDEYVALLSLRAFSIKEQPFWIAMVHDITKRKKSERKLQHSLEQLEKTIEGTVLAMMKVVEIRDPYTSGHQERVAMLATAIAAEMNLANATVRGIHMAALIHDIGKICIPYEILGKPTMLTEQEFDIIKTHSQAGYDILKPVEFPWPVADIVHQHHEKIDGSGYPKGLRKNQICIEAQVICVADVVEAMATHRPYRPARGLEVALDEIKLNREILYSGNIVDSCLAVFEKDPDFLN